MDSDYTFGKSTNRMFGSKTAQKEQKNKELEDTLLQVPVLKQLLEHLEARIAETDSIKFALGLAKSHETSTKNAMIGLNIASEQLEQERSYLLMKIEDLR